MFAVLFLVLSFLALGSKRAEAIIYSINADTKEAWQETADGRCGFWTGCTVAGQPVEIEMSGVSFSDGTRIEDGDDISFRLTTKGGVGCRTWPPGGVYSHEKIVNDTFSVTVPGDYIASKCQYSVELYKRIDFREWGDVVRQYKYNSPYSPPIQAACTAAQCSEDLGISASASYELCAQIQSGTDQYDACFNCFNNQGIWTAVGCIPSEPESVIKVVITIGLALGGGVVLIMILVGSFMLSVSQGDPNKTKEAKEIITSAIIGLLFVIFSVTLLQFIGVSILHIPGFGE